MEPHEEKSQKARGKYDPGWNDPPTFSYNPQAMIAKPKLALNKRVAFPLNSNAANDTQQFPNFPTSTVPGNPLQPMNPFPDTAPTIFNSVINSYNPSLIPNVVSSPYIRNEDDLEGTVDVDEVVKMLNEILDDNKELGNKLEDIRKRINVMKTLWTEGKLPLAVQISTSKLVKALKVSDTKTADEIHKSLMVDHVSSVRSWMVAIKQLILHCTAKNELLAIEDSEKSEECL